MNRALATRLLPYAAIAVALAFAIHALGLRQFGGMDYGTFSRHAWQIYRGQVPYRDLWTAQSPLYLEGGALAYRIFGVRFAALVDFDAVVAAGLFLLLAGCMRAAGLAERVVPWAAGLVALVTMLPESAWAYNPVSQMIAAAFVASAFVLRRRPEAIAGRVAFVATAAALGLCKPNIAGTALAGVTLALVAIGPRRVLPIALLAAAGAIAIAVLLALRIDPRAMVASYLGASGRVGMFRHYFFHPPMGPGAPDEMTATGSLVAPLLLVLAVAVARRPSAEDALLLCAALTACAGIGMDMEFKSVELAPFLAAALLRLLAPDAGAPDALVRRLAIPALALLGVHGAWISIDRERVRAMGPGAFWEPVPLHLIDDPPFLRGVRAGPALEEVAAAMRRIDLGDPSKGSTFLGPRIEFAYPAFAIDAPARQPEFWEWQNDDDPAARALVAFFEERRFDRIVLYQSKLPDPFLPDGVFDLLRRDYVASEDGPLLVWTRR